VSRADKI